MIKTVMVTGNKYIFLVALLLLLNALSTAQSGVQPFQAPKTKTYSILQHSGKYTVCFDQLSKAYNSSLSTQIAKNIFILDSAVVSNNNLDKEQFFSSIYQKKKLNKLQLKTLSGFLNTIENYVYKYTAKVIDDSARLKGIKKFTIQVDTADVDLGEPDDAIHTLVFPAGIIKNIFDISVSSVFDEDYVKDSIMMSNDDLFNILDDDVHIKNHQTFFEWVKFNERFIPPCLPVFSKSDFLEILNNKTFIRKNLNDREKIEYEELKKIVNKQDFKTQLLLPNASTEEVDCFYILMNLVNYSKIPADLIKLNQKVNAIQTLLQKEGDLPDFNEKYTSDYFENQLQYVLVSNYLTLEMYKYFAFLIAHEAYHFWFAPGQVGKQKEYEADKFATMIYLNLFTDATFQAANNLQKQMEQKWSKEIGVDFIKTNTTSGATEEDSSNTSYSSLFKPFLAPPVFEIFKDVYVKTEFYEKHDAFHPPMKDRIEKMKEISDKNANELMAELNNYFSQKTNLSLKNQ